MPSLLLTVQCKQTEDCVSYFPPSEDFVTSLDNVCSGISAQELAAAPGTFGTSSWFSRGHQTGKVQASCHADCPDRALGRERSSQALWRDREGGGVAGRWTRQPGPR